MWCTDKICLVVQSVRWEDLSSHEDLLHQLRQYVEKMSQVHGHILVLFQFGRVQLRGKKLKIGK